MQIDLFPSIINFITTSTDKSTDSKFTAILIISILSHYRKYEQKNSYLLSIIEFNENKPFFSVLLFSIFRQFKLLSSSPSLAPSELPPSNALEKITSFVTFWMPSGIYPFPSLLLSCCLLFLFSFSFLPAPFLLFSFPFLPALLLLFSFSFLPAPFLLFSFPFLPYSLFPSLPSLSIFLLLSSLSLSSSFSVSLCFHSNALMPLYSPIASRSSQSFSRHFYNFFSIIVMKTS